ncbi:MAG TPA: NAD(P)-dependent oxidoreductase [Humidesulfovibrio sp.]|uniref:NAD-dependent epimerase/dehydratase family protein n=1 Tax=Humidesulfovibrio sp. TaxID=2910988 RepID=UPI002D04C1ED|nr:NAD(P)-dependent oxidoreductase [Humidesulfovibrio sp.]HWR03511.1 NAD(P)-dependent oxidoreductase [Humidesulfovibrio sp.]
MRVFITGATGFIGSALANRLAAEGHEVRALVRPGADASRLAPEVERLPGRLDDRTFLAKVLGRMDPGDAVAHLAGTTKAFTARGFRLVNEDLAWELVETARSAGPKGLLFLHVSSQAAAGPCAVPPGIAEEHRPAPVSQYGLSKLLGERAALSLAPQHHVAVIRPSMVYGPGDTAFVPLYSLMRRGLLTVSGPPGQRMSLVHIRDLVDGMVLALKALRDGSVEGGRIYHLAGPQDMDWESYAGAFAAALERPRVRILRVPEALLSAIAWGNALQHCLGLPSSHLTPDKCREARQEGWLLDSSRAMRELGYAPGCDLASGARETIAWCRSQGLLPRRAPAKARP